jgi:DNA topoisomerase VI subunit B
VLLGSWQQQHATRDRNLFDLVIKLSDMSCTTCAWILNSKRRENFLTKRYYKIKMTTVVKTTTSSKKALSAKSNKSAKASTTAGSNGNKSTRTSHGRGSKKILTVDSDDDGQSSEEESYNSSDDVQNQSCSEDDVSWNSQQKRKASTTPSASSQKKAKLSAVSGGAKNQKKAALASGKQAKKRNSNDGAMGDNMEKQLSKSPAEFFAENQVIAGYDNFGKSLYTSLRELIENSLDACESIHVLPTIAISITEYTQHEFNTLVKGFDNIGTGGSDHKLLSLDFSAPTPKKKTPKPAAAARKKAPLSAPKDVDEDEIDPDQKDAAASGKQNKASKNAASNSSNNVGYFLISVRDNGCGMAHDDIPNLLGRVLSGSKYGVRQTRGKFGLGAKMTLIWSKKSTGQPIRITTSHRHKAKSTKKSTETVVNVASAVKDANAAGASLTNDSMSELPAAPTVSRCVLDIDIYKNEPRIIEHVSVPNSDQWIGTQFDVIIAGNWTTYKSRIMNYLQQLAIITPYAAFSLSYENYSSTLRSNDSASNYKKNFTVVYDRRSAQMPLPAREVKHHPESVNNLVIAQLIHQTRTKTLSKFLTTELAAISPTLAQKLVSDLAVACGNDKGSHHQAGIPITADMAPSDLSERQIGRLVQLFHQRPQGNEKDLASKSNGGTNSSGNAKRMFKPPDGSCLSPLGEYNLQLGIQKVIKPDYIATFRDKPSAYEGHPFVVEAAVSLGGTNAKEGITVYRFANRIPLLFEGGADVSTRVATSKIRWANYKIDHKRDKISVFVSIVSTKIPFKGTSKEYIGDDCTSVQLSVRKALQQCGNQLSKFLLKRNALRDAKSRKARIAKYIPDIGRSLFGILTQMRDRMKDASAEKARSTAFEASGLSPQALSSSPVKKRLRLDVDHAESILTQIHRGEITESIIKQSLTDAVELQAPEDEAGADGGVASQSKTSKWSQHHENAVSLYLIPLFNMTDPSHDIDHPLFTFRPVVPVKQVAIAPSSASPTSAIVGTL